MDVTLLHPHTIKTRIDAEKLRMYLIGPFIKFETGCGWYSTFISIRQGKLLKGKVTH